MSLVSSSTQVKYKQYQEATRQALVDLHPKGTPDPVVMVVGAGRGPLVSAALAAARDAGRKIKLYALDKNENAVITLQARVAICLFNHIPPRPFDSPPPHLPTACLRLPSGDLPPTPIDTTLPLFIHLHPFPRLASSHTFPP